MQLEHALDGGQPFEDSLGVVAAVDADAEQNVVRQLFDPQHLGAAQRHR